MARKAYLLLVHAEVIAKEGYISRLSLGVPLQSGLFSPWSEDTWHLQRALKVDCQSVCRVLTRFPVYTVSALRQYLRLHSRSVCKQQRYKLTWILYCVEGLTCLMLMNASRSAVWQRMWKYSVRVLENWNKLKYSTNYKYNNISIKIYIIQQIYILTTGPRVRIL